MTRRARGIARWLTALCVAGSLASGAFAPPVADAQDASLIGYVRGAAGGGAIEGAEVVATLHDYGVVSYAYSNAEGVYWIYLPMLFGSTSATYDISFTAFGYQLGTLTLTVQANSSPRRNIRLTPLPRFALSGVVRSAGDLSPIAGAAVQLLGVPIDVQHTDAQGTFTFAGVPAGRYEVEAAGVCRKSRSKTVVVADQAVTTELRLHPVADEFGHACEEVPFEWIEGATTVPYVYPSSRVELPLPVFFYGRRQAALYLSPVGVASFAVTYPYYYNGPLPAPSAARNALFPFWDDLYSGQWKVATTGTQPDRTFVVEYENFSVYPDYSAVEFEVLIHERDSSIVFQYRTDQGYADGRSATLGIQNAAGSDALLLGFNQPIVREGLAVRLTPPTIDTDADGVPEQIDLCPTVADPEQRDADGDRLGNACDDIDGTLRPTHLQVRRSTSSRRANGRISLDGELLTRGGDDSLATPDGLTVRLTDSEQLDRTIEWTGAECKAKRRGGVRCRRAQAPRHVAEITPLPSDIAGLQVSLVKLRLVQLDLAAPFIAPLRVTMTNDPREPGRGIDRIGTPTDCFARTYGLECKDGRAGSASRAFLVEPPETVFE